MAVPEVVVEGVVFPSVARPPGSAGSHFLGGAGALRCVALRCVALR
jgi:chalcone isomerase